METMLRLRAERGITLLTFCGLCAILGVVLNGGLVFGEDGGVSCREKSCCVCQRRKYFKSVK